ncbi:lysophospholipid acyltransferase family protein [Subtercola boreus]|uniref:1-acyl-sn-glycerol-3-phosphate acyltransferase n=1 Tax=Subtercola boreus TaxID=120213 RepID=A0A3E0WEB0_9MICO|nr:lysophospholipid acyltransferase family protein [Subtercola boreus]RFA22383.1 1-acyl-sn-glycerol-3-phosphate acyltransferase [Subtercola boreus]RFA22445.1 1-acyl-sn-glycerol-3-phosphate acyltransferase [Subtercola boreus]RFA28460.1 1-acyl-sn-glycerol-3-phosphate acyltransferase [Subtercola boreus]
MARGGERGAGAAGVERARRSERNLTFRLLAYPVIPLVAALVKLEVQDAQKLPRTGAFVLTPNHYSNFDPVVVGWSVWKLKRVPRFLAKASLFGVPVLGAALRAIKQVPVERSGRTHGSNPLAAAHDLTVSGEGVIVYPEGTLTRDPELWPMRGKSGAVRIALENDLPVIPLAHWGTQAVLPRWSKKISLFPRKTVHLKYGDEVDLSRFRGQPLTQVTLAEATTVVMDAITHLLEDLRGETAPAERWNPRDHAQSEYGTL